MAIVNPSVPRPGVDIGDVTVNNTVSDPAQVRDQALRELLEQVKADTLKIPDEPAKESGNLLGIQANTLKLDVALSAVLAAIVAQGVKTDVKLVDGSAKVQPVSAATLPLPIGASDQETAAQMLLLTTDIADYLRRLSQGIAKTVVTQCVEVTYTVSTTAMLLYAGNQNALSRLLTNNGAGDLYIGRTQNVAVSGAFMGRLIRPGGAYDRAGSGIYTGEIWGIYSITASAQNVSSEECS